MRVVGYVQYVQGRESTRYDVADYQLRYDRSVEPLEMPELDMVYAIIEIEFFDWNIKSYASTA